MLGRSALVLLAGLGLAGCVSDTPGLDLSSGMWGSQSIYPAQNLVRVERSDLVGRPINAGQALPMAVQYVLADPVALQPQYVAASSTQEPGNYVIIPYSQLHVSNQQITVDTTPRTLTQLPHMTLAEIERFGPATVAAAAPPVPAAVPVISGLPPVNQPIQPAQQPLALVRRGSVVGMPVVDSLGQGVGQVEAVATTPGTGEVRYAIVSGPAFGLGNYVAIPATSTQLAGGRVVVGNTLASLTQMPRYRSEELPQTLGALWSN